MTRLFKHLFWYQLLVGFLLSVGAEWTERLGKAFFLPDEDIYAPNGGRSIFKEINKKCFHKTAVGQTNRLQVVVEDTNSFYKIISSDSGLSISLRGKYTMGFTLGVKTQSLSTGQVDVKGRYTDIYNRVSVGLLDTECYFGMSSSLTDDVLESIDALPLEVNFPEAATSWSKYLDFMKAFGSHMVKKTYHGSRIKHYTFSKMEKQYSEQQLKIRACLDFEGPTKADAFNTTACAGFTQEEAEAVSQLEITSKIDIRGGSEDTRNRLRSDRSEELITKLLNEAKDTETPIGYIYIPLWDIFRHRFRDNSERYAKVLNLQQYYEGFLDFGCTLLEEGDLKLRQFEFSRHSTTEIPDYVCVLEKSGCHTDTDCHHGPFFQAHCYGDTCVEYYKPPFGFKAERARIRRAKSGGDTEGINQSCYYQATPISGKCDSGRFHYKIIWDGVDDAANRPISGREKIQLGFLVGIFSLSGSYMCSYN